MSGGPICSPRSVTPVDELAGALYDSLQSKLLTLPDSVLVYPAHGAGSACGKALSTELSSTIGAQRSTNYALRATDKRAFVELVTEGQPPAPGYFGYDARLNRSDHPLLDEHEPPTAMDHQRAVEAVARGAVLVDGRAAQDFAAGHLSDAINVGIDGRYAEVAGSVIPPDAQIVLVTDPGHELEGKNRLARIGFDRVIGFVDQPYDTMAKHPEDVRIASRLTAGDFEQRRHDLGNLQVVDVRNRGEVTSGRIPSAVPIPIGELTSRLDQLDPTRPTVVYCAGGYRSSVAASVLRRAGFGDVSDILGGYAAWSDLVRDDPGVTPSA